jgi:phenylalanyl-tRNA synthetase beta chain
MKLSQKWLSDYVDITLPPLTTAERLTMAGLEVKSTQVIGAAWEHVVVGQVSAVNPHPNADRLKLATIDLGTEQVTVVCGAPNLRVGDKVPFARVGAELIDGHTGVKSVLKPAKIRGVVSSGMACSEKELGISGDHTGLLVLPADAPVGSPLAQYLGDALFNLEVTPNRPDCLSVIGVARELAALTGQTVRLPDDSYSEVDAAIEQQASVEIQAPDLCPRYCATLIKGIRIAESPAWLKARLVAGGMRPINNIVDVTNFVMLEYGQPLHSFDFDRIQGKKIVVRRARGGEKILTLDNTERELAAGTLVIADAERAVAVAGVMGGANTEVTDYSTNILLEAASFNPASIHYTGRTLGMPSEACTRFERGIRAELTVPALKRATSLIQQLAGGQVAKGIIDVYPGERPAPAVAVSTAQVTRLLGIEVSRDQIVATLTSLGFHCQTGIDANALTATPPYWRSDIRLTEDLIEEVARMLGYDRIPNTMLSQPIPTQDPVPMLKLKRLVRDTLLSYGFDEIVTSSLVGMDALKKLTPDGAEPPALRLVNPMTAEQEYLRPTLRAHLLAALAANQRFAEGGLRLVELSKVYLRRVNDLPDERETVCGVICGPSVEQWWQGGGGSSDFFFARGIVEGLLRTLNIEVRLEEGGDPSLQPHVRASIMAGDRTIGQVGEIAPRVRENFEITGTAYMFELDLAELLPLAGADRTYRPIPRFPEVVRDVAIVVDAHVTHRQVLDIIGAFPLVDRIALFDVYTGEQVPPGKKSLAYRLTFQSPDKTLVDEEVNPVMARIIDKLAAELGATLRG